MIAADCPILEVQYHWYSLTTNSRQATSWLIISIADFGQSGKENMIPIDWQTN